jgi:hypothetical protein
VKFDATLDRREKQIARVIAVLEGIPRERAIAILCMWMSVADVDRMLATLEVKS